MKTICPPSYHHNGFLATHELGHMMYGFTVLVLIEERVLNKLSKEHNISGHKSSTTHRVLIVIAHIYYVLRSYILCIYTTHIYIMHIYYAYILLIYIMHIYYTHLASARFEHSVCRGSLMTTCIMLLA